ncbi:unnamed protein product [Brassica oleracea var. botrytis]|uniref:BnaC02g48520D protein n=1 Tax=Brassica napus TaxID=3708 RepID=A0A078J0N4_BRANA|nr:BnaC02g48520D [Brassica napus]
MYFVRMVAFMPKMNSFEHVLFHFILRYQIPESSCGVREIREAVYRGVGSLYERKVHWLRRGRLDSQLMYVA